VKAWTGRSGTSLGACKRRWSRTSFTSTASLAARKAGPSNSVQFPEHSGRYTRRYTTSRDLCGRDGGLTRQQGGQFAGEGAKPDRAAVSAVLSDLDAYRGAALLMKQHGDDAEIRAAERADEMLAQGDLDGAAVWQLILQAIEELRRQTRQDEKANLIRS
jgi:hypothetical protein